MVVSPHLDVQPGREHCQRRVKEGDGLIAERLERDDGLAVILGSRIDQGSAGRDVI
jgi:hypothetical protein